MRPVLFVLGLLLLVLACAAPGFAQTHPCDIQASPSIQIRRNDPGRVTFCHELRDDVGDPIPVGQVRFYLLDAATKTLIENLGLLQPVTGPNAAGSYYYEQSQPRTYAADVSIVVIAEYNATQSLPSTPFEIDVRGGPKAPSGLRLVLQ